MVREDRFKKQWLLYSSPELEMFQLSYLDQCPLSVVCHQSCVCLVLPIICFNLADLHKVTRCLLKMIRPKTWPPREPPPPPHNPPPKKTPTKNLKTFRLRPLIRILINSAPQKKQKKHQLQT